MGLDTLQRNLSHYLRTKINKRSMEEMLLSLAHKNKKTVTQK